MVALVSCSKREDFSEQIDQPNLMFDKVLNMVSFRGKEDIQDFIENYDQNSAKLNDLYDEGFVPFRVNDRVDEEKFNELSAKKKDILSEAYAGTVLFHSIIDETEQGDEYDEEDKIIINNDKFASILSAKGDILVGGKVYRYTTRGLYIVNKEDVEYLDNYLKDEKNSVAPLYTGLNRINEKIETYVPKREQFDGYSMDIVSGGDTNIQEDLYYASTPGVVPVAGLDIPTHHYDNCTPSRPWIDNIFGRNYACEYRFTRKRKLRSTFAVEDYFFFFDVYAQAKFKKKTWLGWYSSREANIVYVRVKDVNFQLKRRPFKAKIKYSDVEKVFTDISKILENSRNKKVSYVSNIYTNNGFGTSLENYRISEDEIIKEANSYYGSSIFIPRERIPQTKNIRINFEELFGKRPRKVFVVTILGKNYAITDQEIKKVAGDAFKKFVSKINPLNGDDGLPAGVVVVKKDVNSKPYEAEIVSFAFGEDISMVHGYAVASRKFNIPMHLRLDEFSLGFSGNGSSWKPWEMGFITTWLMPQSYDVSVETGAYYDGRWGGSKFRIIKN